MKKNKNEFEDFGGQNDKGVIFQFIPIIILVLIVMIGIFFVKNTFLDSTKNNQEETSLEAGNNNEIPEETVEQSQPVAEKLMEVAADVADMDDINDPQNFAEGDNEGNTGAAVDLSSNSILTNEYETSGVSYGIDVSKYQGGDIDWQKVKDSGITFAMIRVGYRNGTNGIISEDPTAKYNLQQATAVGIKIGVYFFSTAISEEDAKEEAAWVSGFIAPYAITFPVAYNCEGFTSSNSRQYSLSISQRTTIAIAFLDYIQNQGYQPMFYGSKNELAENALWETDKLSNLYKIWIAQYPSLPYPDTQKSSYTGVHAMWQYTMEGQVPGIQKSVDLNLAYFDYSQIANPKDTSIVEEIVASNPEIGITFTEVNETVTAKEKTNLRTVPSSRNGDTILATILNGELVTRTGIGNNGWSRVEYQGQRCYAVSSYLTTNLDYQTVTPVSGIDTSPVTETKTETVTAKKTVNLRSTPSQIDSSNIVAVLNYGDTAVRTASQSDGWSVVVYQDQVLYAVSNLLTTDLNYQTTIVPSTENPETIYTVTEVSDQVTPKIEVNLRLVPSTEVDNTIVVKIAAGEILQRTGLLSNGWSRVIYGEQTLYAVTSYLNVVQ